MLQQVYTRGKAEVWKHGKKNVSRSKMENKRKNNGNIAMYKGLFGVYEYVADHQ